MNKFSKAHSFKIKEDGKFREDLFSAFLQDFMLDNLKTEEIENNGRIYKTHYNYSQIQRVTQGKRPFKAIGSFQKHKDGTKIVVIQALEGKKNV